MNLVRTLAVAVALLSLGRPGLGRVAPRPAATGATLVLASGANPYPASLPGMGPHGSHNAGRLTDSGVVSFTVNSAGANASLPKPHPFSAQQQVFDYDGYYSSSGGPNVNLLAVYDGGKTVDVGGGQTRNGILAIQHLIDSPFFDHNGTETLFEARFYSPTTLPNRDDIDQWNGIFSVSGGTIKVKVLHQSFVAQDDPAVPTLITTGAVYGDGNPSMSHLQLTSGGYVACFSRTDIDPINDRIVVNGSDLSLSAGGNASLRSNDGGQVAHIRITSNPVDRSVYVDSNRVFGEGDTIPGVGLLHFIRLGAAPLVGDITYNNRGDLAINATIVNAAGFDEDIVLCRSSAGQFVAIHLPLGAAPRIGGYYSLNNNGAIVINAGVNGLAGDGKPQVQVRQLDFAQSTSTVVAQYFMADLFPDNPLQTAPYYAAINASNNVAFTIQPLDNQDATYLIGPKPAVDLDIDTFNKNGFEDTFGTPEEDAVEGLERDPVTGDPLTGKKIATNHFDKNFNSCPDFADGWGFAKDPAINTQQNIYERFVPMRLTLPPGTDFNAAQITFTYSFSDPLQVDLVDGKYIPSTSGRLRIWNKVGELPRLPQGLKAGGNIVLPDVPYSPKELGFKQGETAMLLYLEAVGEIFAEQEGPRHITVDCNPGNGDPATQDDVVVTVTDCPPIYRPKEKDGEVKTDDPSGWHFKWLISPEDGLFFTEVGLKDRAFAERMSVAPIVYVPAGGDPEKPLYIALQPDSGDVSPRCQLVDFRNFLDGTTRVLVATYAIDHLPEGPGRCMLVTQRYQFHKMDPDVNVEPSDIAPFPFNLPSIMLNRVYRAARFRPIASYTFHGPEEEAPDFVEIPQYNHLIPDNSTQNNALLLRDDDTAPLISTARQVGRSWIAIPFYPSFVPPTVWVKIPYEVFRDQNPLQLESVVSALIPGQKGQMDNLHFTNEPAIDEPLPPPGCPECIHIHWRWGAFMNFPDGLPLIPRNNNNVPRQQYVDIGLAVYNANETHPFNRDWRSYAIVNSQNLVNSDMVLWYAGFVNKDKVTNVRDRQANGFFTHGGYFAPSRPPKPVFGPRTLNGVKNLPQLLKVILRGAWSNKFRWYWNFGDGTKIDWSPLPEGTSYEMPHTFTAPGHYVVMLFIENEDGIFAGDFCEVEITDDTTPMPVANAGPDQSVEQTTLAGASVNLDGSGSSDPGGNPLTYTWSGPFGTVSGVTATVSLPLGTNTITLTVDNGAGQTATDTVLVTVADTKAPSFQGVPGDVTVEQTSLAGAAVALAPPTATDICDASPVVQSNAPPVFPLGLTIVTWTATDASGNRATAITKVTVVDSTPPAFAALSVSPSLIPFQRHTMVPVVVTAAASDVCDAAPVSEIIAIASNQPDHGQPDFVITGALTANLLAESKGKTDRIYTITVRAIDASGNVVTGTVTVRVPPNHTPAP